MTTVNEILRTYGAAFRENHPFLSDHEKKVMRAIETCRTSVQGGRVEVCSQCGHPDDLQLLPKQALSPVSIYEKRGMDIEKEE